MSGFTSFLKKLGQIIVEGASIAAGVQPFVQPLLGSGKASQVEGTVVNDLTSMSQLVVQVEAIGNSTGLTGPQKLQALVPLVTQIVQTSQLVVGKKVANQALFAQACTEFAQASVDLWNSIDPSEATK